MRECKECGRLLFNKDPHCPDCHIEETPKRKGRGPGKKPALFNTSLRLSREVMDYFNTHHAGNKQAKIREILTEYVKNQTGETNESTEQS